MQKFIKDSTNGLTYELIGEYYYPCLIGPRRPQIGFFGRMRRRYLKEYRRVFYYQLLTSGRLADHLEEIDRAANEMQERLVERMAQAQGVNEKLKAENMMLWVRKMNGIRNQAMEIVSSDLIYA